MEHLTFLLTGPGGVLADLVMPFSPLQSEEARADLAVTLGLVFWVVILIALRLSWSVLWPRLRRSAQAGSQAAQAAQAGTQQIAGASGRVLREHFGTWTWPDLWGAAWRAQVVHMVLYAGAPLLWEAARWALLVVLFPFMIIGFGEKHLSATDGALDHLTRPSCWTFITPCAGPRSAFLHEPVIEASECRSAGDCPPGRAKVPDLGGWVWKGLWAATSIIWIGLWQMRLRRRREMPAS